MELREKLKEAGARVEEAIVFLFGEEEEKSNGMLYSRAEILELTGVKKDVEDTLREKR